MKFARLVTFALCLFSTLAISAENGKTAFLYFGDFGTGDKDQKKVAQGMGDFCEKNRCEFVLSVGDNFYPSGVESTKDSKWKTHFHDVYDPLGLAFYVTLGNHDYLGRIDAQLEYAKKSPGWILPRRYYSFQKGAVEFFAIDTNQLDRKQIDWLVGGLKKSTATWKIVFGHHPIYSFGTHGNSPKLIQTLLPLLRNKAHFYLAGHDHDKQVLTGPDNLALLISGAAAQVRPVGQGSATVYASASLGFMHFEIDDKMATLRVLDAEGGEQFKKEYLSIRAGSK